MNIPKDFAEITYDLNTNTDTIPPGCNLQGKVIIEALDDISFFKVNCQLRYEVRGKINVRKKIIETNVLSSSGIWSKNKTYKFDLDFDIPKNPHSYSGTNLEIVWFLTLEIIPDGETISKIRMNYLKDAKLKKLFKSFKGRITATHPIKIVPNDLVYEVTQEIKTVKNYSGGPIIFGCIILTVIGIFYAFDMHGVLSYITGMIACFAVGYGLYAIASVGLLGKVLLGITPYDTDNFNLDINIEKKSNRIEYMNIFYSIVEEVEDRRGTDRYTLKNTIYTSQKNKLVKPVSKNIEIALPYPKDFYPSSFEFDTEKIYWQIHLAIEFNNNTHFEVKENVEIIQIGS